MRIQGSILDELHQGLVRENTALASAYPWMAALTRTSAQAAERAAQLTRDRTNAAIRGAPIEEQAFYDAAAMMGIGLNARGPAATGGGRFAALFEQPPTAVTRNVPGPAGPAGPAGPPGPAGGADPNRPGTEAGDSPSPGEGGAAGTPGTGAGGPGTPGSVGDSHGDVGGATGDLKPGGAPRGGGAVPSSPMIDFKNPAAQAGVAREGGAAAQGGLPLEPTSRTSAPGGLPLMAVGAPAPLDTSAAGLVAATRAMVNAGWTDEQMLRRATELGLGNPFMQQQTINAIRAGWSDTQTIQAGQRLGLSLTNPLGSRGPISPVTPVTVGAGGTTGATQTGRVVPTTTDRASPLPLSTGVSTQPPGPGPTPAALADLIVQDAITRSGFLPTQEGYVQMLRQVDRMVGLGASREQISDTLIANARTPAGQALIASRAPAPGGITLSPYERSFPALSEGFATSTLGGNTIDPLSGAEMGRIGTIYNTASRRADEDVLRFSDELAGVRGLRQTDTPIGNVTLRERSRLAENIRGAQASTELTMGAQQRAFRESVRQFQEGLRQTAFSNRMQLSGRSAASPAPPAIPPNFTPGGGGNAASGGAQTLAALGANRGTTTTTESTQGFPLGNLISAGGSVLGGLAQAGRLFPSSARVKKAIEPYDRDEYDRALRKLRETPITRWRYHWEPDDGPKHTGPILEMSPEDIKADDSRLDLLSYVGLTHAGVKALDRKVDDLADRFAALATE